MRKFPLTVLIVLTTVALAAMVTGAPLDICHATAPVTSPPLRARSTTTRSPALRMPLLRVTAPLPQ